MNWRKYFSRAVNVAPSGEKDDNDELPDLVELEITDVIDLHSFPPGQMKVLVEEYLMQARMRGYRFVRLIHGRGIGTQRELVRSILAKTPFVVEYHDAPPEAGGWGATIAELAIDN